MERAGAQRSTVRSTAEIASCAHCASLRAENQKLKLELGEADHKVYELNREAKELRSGHKRTQSELRKARADQNRQGDRGSAKDRRERWAIDVDWVRHEVYLAWVQHVDASDRTGWPLKKYDVGDDFADSLLALGVSVSAIRHFVSRCMSSPGELASCVLGKCTPSHRTRR